MKPSFDKELEESLKGLDQSIRLKPEYREQLKNRIHASEYCTVKNVKLKRKVWLSVAAMVILLGTSPFYSQTMAALAAKIIPLEIKKDHISSPDSILSEINRIIEDSGFEAGSIGISADFSIEVNLIKNAVALADMKQIVEPKIEAMLYDKGIDQYKLNIKEYEIRFSEIPDEHQIIDERIQPIVDAAFKAYGQEEYSKSSGYGYRTLEDGTYQVDLNMPDHIKEADSIKQHMMDTFNKENLNVSTVSFDYYNIERRELDGRWRQIADDIYSALAGKSLYNVNGYSYSVKGGKANVKIKTTFTKNPTEAVEKEIVEAIHEYLNSTAVKEDIKDDEYTISFINKNKEVLFDISSE